MTATTATRFDFSDFSDSALAAMISDYDEAPETGAEELDALYAEMIPAAREELRRRYTRTYRIIIDRPNAVMGEFDDYANDYLWTGTKAEFMRRYGLTGKHNPHRDHGTVTLANGYVMHWGVQ